jgi:RimJ/RimL family protein N-acetyltransferase
VTVPINVTDGVVRIESSSATAAGAINAAVTAGDSPIGTVQFDGDRSALTADETLLQVHFGQASSGTAVHRALRLTLHHFATRTSYRTALLTASPGDITAGAAARMAGFTPCGQRAGQNLYTCQVPPITYSDGEITIRRQHPGDIEQHLEAIDDEQIDWLWEHGSRKGWEALTFSEQRARNVRHLRAMHDSFGHGPKWCFSADSTAAPYVVYVDCDLANNHVPPGEANISYAASPAFRGRGYTSRAVRLVLRFLHDHTGAGQAHVVVDAANVASLRVARSVGATETERWRNQYDRTMIRHVRPLR